MSFPARLVSAALRAGLCLGLSAGLTAAVTLPAGTAYAVDPVPTDTPTPAPTDTSAPAPTPPPPTPEPTVKQTPRPKPTGTRTGNRTGTGTGTPTVTVVPPSVQKQLPPGAPTAAQVKAAKAKVKATAASLLATTKELKRVQLQLTGEAKVAEHAIAQWQKAQTAAQQAQAALLAAQTVANKAEAVLSGYRVKLNEYAVSAYKDGGPIAILGAILDAPNPAEVLTRDATLQALGKSQSIVVSGFVAASTSAEGAQANAEHISMSSQHLLDEASSAEVTAARAMQLAQALLGTVDKAKKQLTGTSGDAKKNATKLIKLRLAALAEARAIAARVASANLQRLAAVNGYPEATADQGALALKWAQSQLGVAYSWGGGDIGGPTRGFAEEDGTTAGLYTIGFDCSGLALFAWGHVGYALGHWTGAQWLQGVPVAQSDVRPGDLLFFATDVNDPTTIHHVGLYAGDGMMIDAPSTGSFVRYDPAFGPGFIGAVRP